MVVGFFGDATLQLLTYNGMGGSDGWGLNSYFKQHGRAESMFIASGMMGLFYLIYMYLHCKFGLPLNIWCLALYGIILDLIFRKLKIFQSLDGYYNSLNYFWSAIWGIIPMIIPFLYGRL
jgi:uncharacterized membrane protein YvlD (DUF360 family)